MRLPRHEWIVLAGVLLSAAASAQPPQRDPQAIVILQRSLAAMGGAVPSDSLATGNVVLVAGSKTETGTVRILTRGLHQTAEEILTAEGRRMVVYSQGQAIETEDMVIKSLQMELVVTSQCPDFPLPFLAAVLNDPDSGIQYVGLESFDGSPVHHIRFWKSFSSKPRRQHLATFSVKDVWVDAISGLPRKLSYIRRAARGAEPGIPVEVLYSAYRSVSGLLFPYRIEKSLNGTPWATVTISSVIFNSGLTDTDFPIQYGDR